MLAQSAALASLVPTHRDGTSDGCGQARDSREKESMLLLWGEREHLARLVVSPDGSKPYCTALHVHYGHMLIAISDDTGWAGDKVSSPVAIDVCVRRT